MILGIHGDWLIKCLLVGHTEAILSVAFSPDGTQLATGSGMLIDIVWNWIFIPCEITSSKHLLRRYYGQNLGFEYGNSTAHFERYENYHTFNAWKCMLGNEERHILIILFMSYRSQRMGTLHRLGSWWQNIGIRQYGQYSTSLGSKNWKGIRRRIEGSHEMDYMSCMGAISSVSYYSVT